jgi:hypothetical protein
MTTTTAVTYPTECMKKDAPKNLHLEIEVGENTAYVYCQEKEHVGNHRNRKVTFRADKACTLEFPDGDKVFEQKNKKLELNEGEEKTLFIKDKVEQNGEVSTLCMVRPKDDTRVPPTEHRSPPRIVVP